MASTNKRKPKPKPKSKTTSKSEQKPKTTSKPKSTPKSTPKKKPTSLKKAIKQKVLPGEPVSLKQDIVELLLKVFAIFAILVIVFTSVFGITRASGMSMQPAVKDGDIVLFYRLEETYGISDLIMLEYEGERQVRRVLAVAGDIVDIKNEGLYLNNVNIPSEDAQEILLYENGAKFPLTVPEGHVFVLGDDREDTIDSRMYGTVPTDSLLGKVVTIIRQENL